MDWRRLDGNRSCVGDHGDSWRAAGESSPAGVGTRSFDTDAGNRDTVYRKIEGISDIWMEMCIRDRIWDQYPDRGGGC